MATFPSLYTPNSTVPLTFGSPYIDVGNGGKIKTSVNESVGAEFTETYLLDPYNTASIGWLAGVESIFYNGFQVTNKKYNLITPVMGAGGSLKVSGSGQTGASVIIYGGAAAAGLTVLKQGDIINIGTGSLVYQVTGDVVANASGGATMSVMPQIQSGFTPAQTSSLTLQPFVSFSGYITALDVHEYAPQSDLSMQVVLKFKQSP